MPARVERVARGAVVPRLNGRKNVEAPASFVVIRTSLLLTAKCTAAPLGNVSSGSALWPLGFGWRSCLYCSTASAIDCVKSVFSSAVATGMPFRKSTRSMLFSFRVEYRT